MSNHHRDEPSGTLLGRIVSYAILVIATLGALFPLFWTISTSIKSRSDTFADPPKFVDFEPTAKNYRFLFDDPNFWRIVRTTVLITTLSSLLCLVIGGFAAYALARTSRFPGRRPLEVGMVMVRAIPAIVLMVPLFQILSDLNLYDNVPLMIVLYATVNLPFAIWLLTSFIDQIPVELEEAARVEGAGALALTRRVLLPLMGPGLAATAIFIALLTWNEFLIPVLLAGEDSKTLPVYISGFISNRALDWGPMAAASTLAIIPIAVLTLAVQRWLVSGMSSGAVKE